MSLRAQDLRLAALSCMVVLVATHGGARAQTFHGTMESSINMFPDPQRRELRIVSPFLQWITLRADELAGSGPKDPRLSVHLSGFGGVDLGAMLYEGRGIGDLGVAQMRYKDAVRGTEVVLGRQYLLLGLARAEHFDGLHLSQTLPFGLRAEVFGGAHAGPRLQYRAGDWMVGGRLGARIDHKLSAGISFLQAREKEMLKRELLGADVVLHPRSWVELGAGALYDTIGQNLAQLDVFSTFYPRHGMRISIDWRRVIPVALLDKTSIFSVFSDSVRNEAGGDISWKVSRRWTLRADGHVLAFDEGQSGYRAGASAIALLGSRDDSTLTMRVGRWQDAADGYTELRAAVRHYFTSALYAAVDAQAYLYDVGSNGHTFSFGVTGALGYEVTRRVRAVIAAEGGITPSFETRGQLIGRLEWSYFTSF